MPDATTNLVLRVVGEVYDLDETTLLAATGRQTFEPRAVAIALIRRYTRQSWTQLAGLFQRGDHTTIGNALTRAEEFFQTSAPAQECERRVSYVLAQPAGPGSAPGRCAAQTRLQRSAA